MRFDSGPEVFVRVNRNYVLTEYVLNENDCTRKKFYQHIRHHGAYTTSNRVMVFHFGSGIIFLFLSFLPSRLPVPLRAQKSDRWWREFLEWNLINPLSAKQSFQLWYPGGQRLKVISFSWSWVKSPSTCFSNAEPTTIIASRDEKRCNASVQWTRLVHSRSLRLGDQHRKCHGWLLFFAVPDLHPDQRAAVQPHAGKKQIAKR